MLTRIRRVGSGVVVGGLLAFSVIAAPTAHGLGIEGPSTMPQVCGNQEVITVVLLNATNQTQQASITAGSSVAKEVDYAYSESGLPPETCFLPRGDANSAFTSNLPSGGGIAPGGWIAFYLSVGGQDRNLIGGSTFSLGGVPNGTPNAAWYDFQVTLNADESFQNLTPYYSGTGGTDSATSNQNNFVMTECGANGMPTSMILTPYSSGNATVMPVMGGNMCFAWLQQGAYVDYTATAAGPSAASIETLAVQYNGPVSYSTTAMVQELNAASPGGMLEPMDAAFVAEMAGLQPDAVLNGAQGSPSSGYVNIAGLSPGGVFANGWNFGSGSNDMWGGANDFLNDTPTGSSENGWTLNNLPLFLWCNSTPSTSPLTMNITFSDGSSATVTTALTAGEACAPNTSSS